ncbi:hypothetical protein ADL03_42905 [Nocardia sp. NRRL S-836]|nr:hypothetical protein ADL03_42905 [Nocardia sp. NRRL S-836]
MSVTQVAEKLQDLARAGEDPLALGKFISSSFEWKKRGSIFVGAFHLAFNISIASLYPFSNWVGFGAGNVSDEEFKNFLEPFVDEWRNQ